MKTFRVYSLNDFQIFNTVLLLITILPWCTLHLHNISFITGNLYLLTPFIPLTCPPLPSQSPNCSLCLKLDFDLFCFLDSKCK